MDLVPMHQEIDGEVQHITVHPAAVVEWEQSGWKTAEPTEAAAPAAEISTAKAPRVPRPNDTQEG